LNISVVARKNWHRKAKTAIVSDDPMKQNLFTLLILSTFGGIGVTATMPPSSDCAPNHFFWDGTYRWEILSYHPLQPHNVLDC